LSLRPDLIGGTFHLVNHHAITWSRLFDLVRTLGYELDRATPREWIALAEARSRDGERTAVGALLPFLTNAFSGATLPRFDCRATSAALAAADIVVPPLDAELLEVYFARFVGSGFIDADRDVLAATSEEDK
jgi:hypothetical protein